MLTTAELATIICGDELQAEFRRYGDRHDNETGKRYYTPSTTDHELLTVLLTALPQFADMLRAIFTIYPPNSFGDCELSLSSYASDTTPEFVITLSSDTLDYAADSPLSDIELQYFIDPPIFDNLPLSTSFLYDMRA